MDEANEIRAAVAALIGVPVTGIHEMGAGRNSRACCVVCGNGGRYAVKKYPTLERLAVEFEAYRLVYGLDPERRVPFPLTCDPERAIGVYEFVPGASVAPGQATAAHIVKCARFLIELDRFAGSRPEPWPAEAAEAQFSFAGVVANIRARLDALETAPGNHACARDLHEFLEHRLIPVLDDVVGWGARTLSEKGLDLDTEIGPNERVLSPSDFGLHNAILRKHGGLVFVDFEYFGWDDPAKMVADFILHPAMDLDENLKQQFVTQVCQGLTRQRLLVPRLPVAYALFGIKWCTILLNEFVPEHQARRRFAGDTRSEAEMLAEQLDKAQRLLNHVADAYQEFPYLD
jgi:hypothetical protein